jgi:hypothetical protein
MNPEIDRMRLACAEAPTRQRAACENPVDVINGVLGAVGVVTDIGRRKRGRGGRARAIGNLSSAIA